MYDIYFFDFLQFWYYHKVSYYTKEKYRGWTYEFGALELNYKN